MGSPMRLVLAVAMLGGCAHRPAVTPAIAAAPSPPIVVPAPKVSVWPVPVKVMTWTAGGIVTLGELPDHPPAAVPATPWFVEPTRPLDAATLRSLVDAVRSEHVPGLSLRGQALAASDLAVLDRLPELTALVLDDTAVDDVGALHVTLKRLYLARTTIDDGAVKRLVAAQPELEVLDVEDTQLGDAALRDIALLGELRALNLAGTRITDAGGPALGALSHLEILDAGRTAVGAKTVAAIRPLALRELFLDGTRVGKEIGSLDGYAPGIVRFDVSSLAAYKPTDSDVAWLASAPNLVEAGLNGAHVHDPTVLALAKNPKLRELRLAGTAITLAAIRQVASLTDLEEVDLAETPVDNASAAALLALPRLRMLRLDRTPIDDAALRAMPGPALVELYLAKTKIGDAGAEILDATPHLVALGLGETQIGDATLARIGRLVELKTLVLSATKATHAGLAELAKLPALERLYLDQLHADDETIAGLANAHDLRVLHVEGTEITDEGVELLKKADRLEELTIGDSRVKAIAVDGWPRLHTLSLLGLAIDDSAFAALAKHDRFVALDLSSTEITNPAPLAALAHLRVVGLAQTKLSKDGEVAAKKLAASGVEIVR